VETVAVNDLYLPSSDSIQWSPTEKIIHVIGDRVCYLGGHDGVPFGERGTIIGTHPGKSDLPGEYLLDVLFDRPVISGTSLNNMCSESLGVTLKDQCVLNITQGSLDKQKIRMNSEKAGKEPIHVSRKVNQPREQQRKRKPKSANDRQRVNPTEEVTLLPTELVSPSALAVVVDKDGRNSPAPLPPPPSANPSGNDNDIVAFWNSLVTHQMNPPTSFDENKHMVPLTPSSIKPTGDAVRVKPNHPFRAYMATSGEEVINVEQTHGKKSEEQVSESNEDVINKSSKKPMKKKKGKSGDHPNVLPEESTSISKSSSGERKIWKRIE